MCTHVDLYRKPTASSLLNSKSHWYLSFELGSPRKMVPFIETTIVRIRRKSHPFVPLLRKTVPSTPSHRVPPDQLVSALLYLRVLDILVTVSWGEGCQGRGV